MSTESSPNTTILVVDDVPENVRLLIQELQQYGYTVRGVLDGAMALTVVHSTPIHLILLDVRLPDMDGYAVCQALQADPQTAKIPVIFISALDEPLDKVKAFSVGGVDYITKPFKIIEVIARIKTQLNLRQAQQKLEQFNHELEAQVRQRTAELEQINETLRAEVQVRRQAEANLSQSEARYKLIAKHMSDVVCLHEADGRFTYVSPSCQALLGYEPEALLGRNLQELCHPEDLNQLHINFTEPIATARAISSCYRIRCQDNRYIWIETLAKPLKNDVNEVTAVVTSSRDVTQRIEIEERLRHDALHDGLTGLPNRNWLSQQLDLELARYQRHGGQFGLLMIDLDQFKAVNDTLGHFIGDQLLIAVAQSLQNCVRAGDAVVRIGGDEFIVLLDSVRDIHEAIQISDRIRATLKTPFDIQGKVIRSSASIGILLNENSYSDSSHLLRDVDIALYQAKAAGRDCQKIFGLKMFQETLNRVSLENDLHTAIAAQNFIIYYQPIYDLATIELLGFEALVRWHNPDRGLIMPTEFIDLAEETGLITEITHQVIQQVCHSIHTWDTACLLSDRFRIAVNISGQNFRDPYFLSILDDILADTHVSASRLTLEITERILLEQSSSILEMLSGIQQRGMRLSIDDFGTGYSSLKYLSRFPVNILKIDKSFINELRSQNQGIVRAIIDLAHNLNMVTVAEGVEQADQVQQLLELGCEAAQGYFFAQPLPLVTATELLTGAAAGASSA